MSQDPRPYTADPDTEARFRVLFEQMEAGRAEPAEPDLSELHDELEALAGRVSKLETQYAALEARVKKLEEAEPPPPEPSP